METIGSGDHALFVRRLAADGLDEQGAKALLGKAQLADGQALPRWQRPRSPGTQVLSGEDWSATRPRFHGDWAYTINVRRPSPISRHRVTARVVSAMLACRPRITPDRLQFRPSGAAG
jgi:hypothetical protein